MISFSEFAGSLAYDAIPEEVRAILRRSFADIIGVAVAGSTTEMSSITRKIADRLWRSSPETGAARMLFDGRPVSPSGAAFAGAFTIDSIDAHDSTSPCKGHAGSALLAIADSLGASGAAISGKEFMVALAVAYEISYRAGLTLHGTVPDYHTSRAWTAVGVALGVSRLLGRWSAAICHSAVAACRKDRIWAAERFDLVGTKWFRTAEKIETKCCNDPIDRNPCRVRSRFLNGRCEFSALLFNPL